MTQQERLNKLQELRDELHSANRFRSRDEIIKEGKTIKAEYERIKNYSCYFSECELVNRSYEDLWCSKEHKDAWTKEYWGEGGGNKIKYTIPEIQKRLKKMAKNGKLV